jgi:hypothetical protein
MAGALLAALLLRAQVALVELPCLCEVEATR